ncbi:uncharacterized protein LOC125945393 [Dermacentor silvarum]|uniref:uncharacterized protein LOC125945393 n=1 Tax=Dermacentor silvarum TaxID=543639 RepID=UPI002101AE88|nr:uncharacterized protein LOC125945393 [Dermacentor silvarum]
MFVLSFLRQPDTEASSASTRSNVYSGGSPPQSHPSETQLQASGADDVALNIRRMAGTLPDLVRVAQERLAAQREIEASNILYFGCGFCFLMTLSAALLLYAVAREVWRPTMGKTEIDSVPTRSTHSSAEASVTGGTGGSGTTVSVDATT